MAEKTTGFMDILCFMKVIITIAAIKESQAA